MNIFKFMQYFIEKYVNYMIKNIRQGKLDEEETEEDKENNYDRGKLLAVGNTVTEL